MKNLLYILTIILLLTSCRSIDKMIEQGRYDDAFRFGVDKLRGKKNKKTKYVRGLEKAYAKLNARDLKEIKKLTSNPSNRNLDIIVDIYTNMDGRQDYLSPLLPLRSEDGYRADFTIVDYTTLIRSAKTTASEYHYTELSRNLEYARSGDKAAARTAYNNAISIDQYFQNFKNTRDLKREAYDLGQKRILIETYAQGNNIIYNHALSIISQLNASQLNTTWEKFYTTENEHFAIDYVATLEISSIHPGKERERIHSFTESKKIKIGSEVSKKKKGMVKDTTATTTTVDKFKTVTAHIEEIEREKQANLIGKIIILDVNYNQHLKTIPINLVHEFIDYSSRYIGDERALTEKTRKRLKNSCARFPTDYEITENLAFDFKDLAYEKIDKERF